MFGVLTSGVSISAALMIASRLELVGAEMDALLVLYCGFDEYSPAIMLACWGQRGDDESGRKAIKRDFVVNTQSTVACPTISLGNYS